MGLVKKFPSPQKSDPTIFRIFSDKNPPENLKKQELAPQKWMAWFVQDPIRRIRICCLAVALPACFFSGKRLRLWPFGLRMVTPWKINMEHGGLEDLFFSKWVMAVGSMLIFQGVGGWSLIDLINKDARVGDLVGVWLAGWFGWLASSYLKGRGGVVGSWFGWIGSGWV